MGVVLVEAAHTHEAMELAGFFVAVYQTDLSHTDGKIPVGTGLRRIHQNTARTVHGFYSVVFLVNDRGVHIVFVMIPVS